MSRLLYEIEQCRKRWVNAKKKGDTAMMGLWKKVGDVLKDKVEEQMGDKDLFETAKGIFERGNDEKKRDS